MIDGLFKGPQITWNRDDVRKFVDRFEFDGACSRIADGVFEISYVRDMVHQMLAGDEERVES